ncbi:hypothetical protein RSG05_004286 [Yersinia enterocolitica]|nr:hypothetical protein [Yersinia enterocolitica]
MADLRGIMVSFYSLYAFIKKHYRHSRFEGRNNDKYWSDEYSKRIVISHMESLCKYGKSYISRHECNIGQGLCFDINLNVLGDDNVIDYPSNAGNLTHILN